MKKVITIILSIALFVSGMTVTPVAAKDTMTPDEWKTQAITAPKANSLIGAGHIDLKWWGNLENASKYTAYVDSKAVKTLNAGDPAMMSVDFYTVKVSAHTAYVVAEQTDGTKVQTDTVKFYVTKKGICVNTKDMGVKVDPADMNLGWYYNWDNKSFEETGFSNTKFYGMDYVPQFWGDPRDPYPDCFDRFKAQGYKYVLGFNEPDLVWESNFKTDVAMRRWMKDIMPNKGNMLLGSPAVSVFPQWSDWWKQYWNILPGSAKSATNFIAVHNYNKYYNGSQTALDYLEKIDECYNKYRKPIWITEFAIWKFDKNDKAGCAKTQEFMRIVLKGLNERSYVERYAWFSPDYNSKDASSSSLFDYGTGNLTTIGKVYAQIGNPAGYPAKTYGVPSGSNVNTSVASCIASQKTTLYGLTKKKKAFKYSIKAMDGAVKYQIQYSLSKKFSKKKKYKTKIKTVGATTSDEKNGTIKKLKKKKRYYVRVRAIKQFLGKNYYCAWSGRQSVKTKK
ncbi:MAG: hypothetical protein J6W35_03885 [Eubacterium sp.]|nr:hypothetical protein [Eubacterium sp.]